MRLGLLFWLGLPAAGQTLQLLSEFRRVDAKGNIVAADAGGRPREILSPGLVRNGYHTIRIVIRPPQGKPYTLDMAQNPENSAQMHLYRENGDVLTPVKAPVTGYGNGAETFWLDLFVPPEALVRRVRIEVQLHDGDTWHVAPMEARVLAAILPTIKVTGAVLPPVSAPSDAVARQTWCEWLCQDKRKAAPWNRRSVRGLQRRNALQDVALARLLELRWRRGLLRQELAAYLGTADVETWCTAPPGERPHGPEWALRLRDYLNRESSR